ncbi:hypothetical protein RFI_15124 [Reticulomyxa filosa]|uniref:Kelch motif family protein n=1 Tax=Reticulomyxa filosa TaxID=46433 RepID=X6N830_RETFI|nr:hypothetical protein RFI_15124 [Reticulomyxa filosa]|eukprot:ETO22078.1 hypothetical protein RFI_15124 [Reticulomyxa filosa]
MANRTTIQRPPERQTKQTQHLNSTPFQHLKKLPTTFYMSQCVLHKHEILICGGFYQRVCYSYHILKNEYKFICEYPRDVRLHGHCVVKLVDNNKHSNEITLLSFGSDWDGKKKHTLIMKYVSVWSNASKKSNELNNYNQWIPLTDNQNHPIIIGRDNDVYQGMRALIGGRNNNFIFDLNTFQFIKHNNIPSDDTWYHCFVSNSENGQGQEMIKTDEKKINKIDIAPLFRYGYIYVNDAILFFGGLNNFNVSRSLHKYSIRENKWTTLKNILPSPLYNCVAVLSEEDNDIHIIGGQYNKKDIASTHIKTKVRIWDISQLSKNEIKFIIQNWVRSLQIKFGWINDFDQIIFKYSRMK